MLEYLHMVQLFRFSLSFTSERHPWSYSEFLSAEICVTDISIQMRTHIFKRFGQATFPKYCTDKSWLSPVQFSRSVVTDSLRPHESQHARHPCPSPTPGVHSNSCPSSRWCHPDILSSVIPFSSCPQSIPASESFPMRQLFAWGGQSIGLSALASFLPKNTQDWSPLEWTPEVILDSFTSVQPFMYSRTIC